MAKGTSQTKGQPSATELKPSRPAQNPFPFAAVSLPKNSTPGASHDASAAGESGAAMAAQSGGQVAASTSTEFSPAERRLMERVFARWHAAILAACRMSSVPEAFLGALTANESAGYADARRFEPAVFGHLEAVARGERDAYGSITRAVLDAKIRSQKSEIRSPETASANNLKLEISDLKAEDDSNSRFKIQDSGTKSQDDSGSQTSASAAQADHVLRELATSWGLTQIMGYHLVGRSEAVSELLNPEFHFQFALELLSQFAHSFQLDPANDFEEMFHCWNTGRPYGPPRGPATYDPHYVENGMRRMEIYKAVEESKSQTVEGPETDHEL